MVGGLASCQSTSSSSTPSAGSVEADEEYVVKFNNNYDGKVIKVTVLAGKTVTLPEDPVRPGYIFGGWFMDYRQDCTEEFDESLPINADITVYAKWLQNEQEHIVTFHFLDKVTSDVTVIVDHGDTLVRPADPVYPDGTMAFTGWYTDPQCTSLFDFSAKVNGDLELYAGWKVSKAVITFNLNYTGSSDPWQEVVDLDVPMDEPSVPAREHYAFVGWYDRSVGGTQFNFDDPVTSDMTLFAHWEESEFLVTFDANGATVEKDTTMSAYVSKDGSAESLASAIEAKMDFAGHDFKGWFAEKLDPSSDEDATAGKTQANLTAITGTATFYAGWALSTYQVSFSLGYDGATDVPSTQSVKYGKQATEPTTPERDGYTFGGWFIDEELSEQFTFDMAVTGDLNLHAKWIENSVAHDPVTVTYYVGSTVYDTKSVEFNAAASSNAPSDPTKTNAIFGGWYRDSSFTTKFNMNANLSENVSVYAKFLDRHTFEAEAIDFTDKYGQGTSTNSYEEGLIMDYTFVDGGSLETVSNGYFVRELYYNGATLDFDIQSSKDVDDAIIYLRVSSESYEFFTTKEKDGKKYNYLSKDEFKVVINAEWDGYDPLSWLDYDGLYMPMANLINREDLADHKTPFENAFISANISLKEGMNHITLLVDNNNNHGGTFHAECPIIDCMYIYSDATLSMTDYEFYLRENVKRG